MERLRKNAALETGSIFPLEEEDVFSFLKSCERRGDAYDLIILDPPSFTRARGRINDALEGYRNSISAVPDCFSADGLLATFSCSHHVSAGEFESTVAAGSFGFATLGPDHSPPPVSVSRPPRAPAPAGNILSQGPFTRGIGGPVIDCAGIFLQA